MTTVLLAVLAVLTVALAGELVRCQCRRMVSRPAVPTAPLTASADVAP